MRLLILFIAIVSVDAQTAGTVSLKKEAALGAGLVEHAKFTAIHNLELEAFIDGVGQRLAVYLPSYDLPYRFTIVEDTEVSNPHWPVAYPGGYVFVPLTLLQAAQNESEFAGMVAHAMAHIALRQQVRPAATSGSTMTFFFMGPWDTRWAGNMLPAAYQQMEMDADAAAARAMPLAGYDPAALVQYIERVQVRGREQRLTALNKVIETVARPEIISICGNGRKSRRAQDR